ncbi:MAG: hypothetical protein JEZ11_13165 [Desulfobacterales bacterium]|nr:hypothetical protein [Desulfobacterales bacterium]
MNIVYKYRKEEQIVPVAQFVESVILDVAHYEDDADLARQTSGHIAEALGNLIDKLAAQGVLDLEDIGDIIDNHGRAIRLERGKHDR